jgi:hypothetical protein
MFTHSYTVVPFDCFDRIVENLRLARNIKSSCLTFIDRIQRKSQYLKTRLSASSFALQIIVINSDGQQNRIKSIQDPYAADGNRVEGHDETNREQSRVLAVVVGQPIQGTPTTPAGTSCVSRTHQQDGQGRLSLWKCH